MSRIRRTPLTVPLPLLPPREKDWREYLRLAVKMRADRVLLFAPMDSIIRKTVEKEGKALQGLYALSDAPDLAFFRVWSGELKERIRFFGRAGIETGFWLGHTIGHGGVLSGTGTPRFQPLVGPSGKPSPGCFCPADGRFRRYISSAMAIMAESGVAFMLLDDDFRLGLHGAEAPVGCFCPLHLKRFAEKSGRRLSRPELFQKALCGRPGRTRALWLKTLAGSLMDLAEDISRAVHAVNPAVRLGLCTAMTLWSSEGVDMRKLLTILAGGNRPVLRLIGAPYWSRDPAHPGWIIEYGRLQKSFLNGFDAEILTEGDTFPHTRYFCAAESLAAFESGMACAGLSRPLLYPVLYAQSPSRERGFTDRIAGSRRAVSALASFVPEDYLDLGAELAHAPGSFLHTPMPEKPGPPLLYWPDEPAALRILARLGIPLGYGGSGPAVFAGHGAAGLADKEIRARLMRGALADAAAAGWLTKRGFDLGMASSAPAPVPAFERFLGPAFNGPYARDQVLLVTGGEQGLYRRARVREGATVLSEFIPDSGREPFPAVYLYRNAEGMRVCVSCFDFYAARHGRQLAYSGARQEQWARALAWASGRPLPAVVPGEPDLHLICRAAPDGGRIAVCIQNLRLDPLVNPVVRLDPGIEVNRDARILPPGAAGPVRLTPMEKRFREGFLEIRIRARVPAMGTICLGLPQKKPFRL